jgi:uncharacterized membrane protein YgcG
MDIVLGVSLAPKTVRMVLVEGVKGDGAIVDHDTFEVAESGDSAISNAVDQVVAAIVGTQESAAEGGHDLTSIGVTWSDRSEAAELRDALAGRNIRDVILVSELHAAGALAQAAGRAVGYDNTALLFVDRDSATLSVVRSDDGSIVKVLSNNLHGSDAMAMLAEMVSAVEAQDAPPQGIFVVGSGVDITSVKEHLEDLVSLPVRAPEESGLALARGAALAAANAPTYDATTAGLAYSLDPEGATAGNEYGLIAGAATMRRAVDVAAAANAVDYDSDLDFGPVPVEEGRKPFLLVGSALTSIFVVGVVALVISLAVSIRPTADQRPSPGPNAIVPSVQAPAPAPVQEAQQPVAPPPPPETIKPPVPVAVQEAPPPRQVFVEQAPAPQAPAPAPAAPPPPPEAPPPAPIPVAPAPVPYIPPVYSPPVYNPYQPPPAYYPRPRPWTPPWSPPWQQQPQEPQYPQDPPYQQPQNPQWPLPGGGGSGGSGDYPGSGGSGGYPGSGGSGGSSGGSRGSGNCFLIFCSFGHH